MTVKFSPDGFLDIATEPSDLPGEATGKDEKSGAMRRCTNLHLDKTGMASTRHGSSKINSSALHVYAYDYSYLWDWEDDEVTGDAYQCLHYWSVRNSVYCYPWEVEYYFSTTSLQDTGYQITHAWEPIPPSAGTAYNIVELNGARYVFSGDKLYRDETEIEDELYGAKWGAIKYNPYNSDSVNIFALNDEERIRIDGSDVYNWGISSPTTAPAIQAILPTGLTGDYNAKYTQLRKEGTLLLCESDPSDAAAAAVTLTDQSLRVICHHDIDDPQINNLRVYRTFAGQSTYYQDQDIALADYANYAYTYQWEYDYEYISGTGYLLVVASDTGQFEKKENYEDGTNNVPLGFEPIPGIYYHVIAQGFKANSDYDLAAVGIELKKIGTPGNFTLSIYSDDGGEPGTSLASTTIMPSQVDSDYGWLLAIFNQTISLTQDTLYWLVLEYSTGSTYNCYYLMAYARSTNQYGDTNEIFKYGQTISTLSDKSNWDLNFRMYEYTGTLNQYLFDWEEDYDTASNHGAAKNCHHWEPGLLISVTADTSLGTEVATDHDRPPLGSFVFGPSFNGTCFILKDNKLYYCLPKQPEYWPLTYFLEVCSGHSPAVAGTIYGGQVYVASAVQIYQIPGTGHTSFGSPISANAITGTVSAQCFLPIHGHGLFHLGNDGLYRHSGEKDENITNARFKPIFDGDTVGSIPGINASNIANCWLVYYKSKLYFGYPESGSTYPDNFIVTDLSTGKSIHYDYGGTAFPCAVVDEENDRLLTLDTAGYIWKLEDPDETDDGGTDISWQIESKEYSDQLRKYFPRYARYDVNLGTDATATGYVLLDGTSQQSHSITVSRAIKKRLIEGGNGDRIALRITGTGPVDIFAAEAE